MKNMWSPWRSKYIESFSKPARKKKSKVSLFTAALMEKKDDKHFIVHRGKSCFVIMNLYPYNSGHLMVVPYREVSTFPELTAGEHTEVMLMASYCMQALDRIMKPHGYNFGANIGRVSGAGVENHVHFHIVPRWNGDTNFMPVVSSTKVISQDMRTTLGKLRREFKRLA